MKDFYEIEKEALRPPPKGMTFEELCAAERLWHSSPGLQDRFSGDFNAYLHAYQGCEVDDYLMEKTR